VEREADTVLYVISSLAMWHLPAFLSTLARIGVRSLLDGAGFINELFGRLGSICHICKLGWRNQHSLGLEAFDPCQSAGKRSFMRSSATQSRRSSRID
jgi:hypothetical protein